MSSAAPIDSIGEGTGEGTGESAGEDCVGDCERMPSNGGDVIGDRCARATDAHSTAASSAVSDMVSVLRDTTLIMLRRSSNVSSSSPALLCAPNHLRGARIADTSDVNGIATLLATARRTREKRRVDA